MLRFNSLNEKSRFLITCLVAFPLYAFARNQSAPKGDVKGFKAEDGEGRIHGHIQH